MIWALLAASLSGAVPASLGAPARVAWVSAAAADTATCSLVDPTRWSCEGLAADAAGVVVLVGGSAADSGGENEIAYAVVRARASDGMRVRRHGRLIAVPGVALADQRDAIRAVAAALDRSPIRPAATRFAAVTIDTIDIVPIASDSIWIAWDEGNDDAFVTLTASGMATARISVRALVEGDVGQPYLVAAALPITLSGRVESNRGEPIGLTDVELFAILDPPAAQASDADLLSLPMLEVARASTDEAGSFAFERAGPGPFVAFVTDATRGRGHAVARSPSDPLTIRITPPPLATGRVLYHDAPVPGARVRFVPNVQTLAAAVDVRDAASIEQQTGDDGRFGLALPPTTEGVIQAIGPDGNTARVPLASPRIRSDIDLGDIRLPRHRRLTVRLDAAAPCVLNAVGPLGSLGVSMVSESASSSNLHWFDLPEPGQWMLDADCGGRAVPIVPSVVSIPAEGPDTTFDAKLAGSR